MDIIRNNITVLSIHPEDSSEYINAIMGEECVILKFRSRKAFVFMYNDKVIFEGKEFLLKSPCAFKNLIQGWYEYELRFEGSYYALKECAFLNFDVNSTVPPSSDFNITSQPQTMLRLLVNNLKRNGSSHWSVGNVSAAGAVTINFQNQSCHDALQSMASAFNLEYHIDGTTIHFGRVESTDEPLVLAKGQGRGLTRIEASSMQARENLITRLYPYGSTRNMQNNHRLKLPDAGYLEKHTDIFGIIERIQIYEDIFPRFVWRGHGTPGSVTSVSNNDETQKYSFVDEFLDFDVNEQGIGVSPKIVFATGELSGLTFEVSSFDNEAKRFELKLNPDNLPSGNMVPNVGDEYYLSDITMPQSYIDIAQQELFDVASADMDALSNLDAEFNVETDNIYFKNNRISLRLGTRIELVDKLQDIDMITRVFSFSKSLNYPYRYKNLSLKNTLNKSSLARLARNISENAQGQSSLRSAATEARQSMEAMLGNAIQAANNALQTANGASALATSAGNAATTAATAAGEAKSTANAALHSADSAAQTAQNALYIANEVSTDIPDLTAKYNDLERRITALEATGE